MIIGNLGQDAQVRQTQQGKQFLSFSVAVSEKKGEERVTRWFSCSAWGDRYVTGGIVQYLKSGTKVFIEGKYEPSIYNRQDGSVDISHNIMVANIELISVAQQNTVAAPGTPVAQPHAQAQAQAQPNNVQWTPPVAPMAQPIQSPGYVDPNNPDDDLPF